MVTFVRCDNVSCRKEFKLDQNMIITEPVKEFGMEDVEKTYFCCPHCGDEYIVIYKNPEIKKIISKIKELTQRIEWINRQSKTTIQKRLYLPEYLKYVKQRDRLQKKGAKQVDKLRNKIERGTANGKATSIKQTPKDNN